MIVDIPESTTELWELLSDERQREVAERVQAIVAEAAREELAESQARTQRMSDLLEQETPALPPGPIAWTREGGGDVIEPPTEPEAPAAPPQASPAAVDAVLVAIRRMDGWVGTRAVHEAAGVSYSTTCKALKMLGADGRIEHNGKGGAHSRYRRLDDAAPDPEPQGAVSPHPQDHPEGTTDADNGAGTSPSAPPEAPMPTASPAPPTRAPKPRTRGDVHDNRDRQRITEVLRQNGEQRASSLASIVGITAARLERVAGLMLDDDEIVRRELETPTGTAICWRLPGQALKLTGSMSSTTGRTQWEKKREAEDQAAAAAGEQTLRQRIIATLEQAGDQGLTMAHIVGACPGPELANKKEEMVRELWRGGKLGRRRDGTYVIASTAKWYADEEAHAA